MIKPQRIKRGDKVAIVSLSSGVIGEEYIKKLVITAQERLEKEFGLQVVYMPNSRKGEKVLSEHPELRAADLIEAFKDPTIKIIWTAVGGDDTFRTNPFLVNDEFKKIVRENPKIFIGFSDTTTNHFVLYSFGLCTYYGPSLLSDLSGSEMIPFTKEWIDELFEPHSNKLVTISPTFMCEQAVHTPQGTYYTASYVPEKRGIEFLRGKGRVTGNLLGGCLDSIAESILCTRYPEQETIFKEYPLLPPAEQWKGVVLFIETSEETPNPDQYTEMLEALDQWGVFKNIVAIIHGKPMNEKYYSEYQSILLEATQKYELPCVMNLNFGHSAPRLILPYGQPITIDFDTKTITLDQEMVS